MEKALDVRRRLPKGQHRALRATHDRLRDTAHEQSSDPRATVSAHDDQINLVASSELYDRIGWVAKQQVVLALDVLVVHVWGLCVR